MLSDEFIFQLIFFEESRIDGLTVAESPKPPPPSPYIPFECQNAEAMSKKCQAYLGVSDIYNTCQNVNWMIVDYFSLLPFSSQTAPELESFLFQTVLEYCSITIRESEYFIKNENVNNYDPLLESKTVNTSNNRMNPNST